jgi:O-antigen/teichoic acid export membrane protein
MSAAGTGLIRHTTVYGIGQMLTRIGSVLMLPVYTHYLTPADYGTIAIFDLVTGMLVILFGFGVAPAAQRYHFDTDDEEDRAAIWSAAFLATALPPLPFLAIAWWWRVPLAGATHGVTEVADLYSLVLPTLWLTTISLTANTYLRTRKRSTASVVLSLGGLALNIGLNLYLLVVAERGLSGVLLGNLIATAVATAARALIVFAEIRPTAPSRATLALLWRFGAPLAVAALLAAGMHQLDRYLLRLFRDLEEVGLYSLAYTLAQGAVSLLLVPFAATWEAVRYEIARHREAPLLYARVFRAFTSALGLLSFAVALFAGEVLALIAPPSYRPAAPMVPVLVLAYLVFSMHLHFSVPAYVRMAPQRTMAVFAAGLAVNIASNLALVPAYGGPGAAVATLLTFVAFSGIGLWRYSKIERYPYPLLWCAAMIGTMVFAFVVQFAATAGASATVAVVGKITLWLGAAALLAKPLRRDLALLGIAGTPATDSAARRS